MTSLDFTFVPVNPARSRLSQSSQRVLMALTMLALFFALLLPTPLLNQITGYAEPGGMPLLKFHFYTYMLFLALLFVVACIGPLRFVSEQSTEQFGATQFAIVVLFCAAITIARQGTGGVAYMVNTLFAAPLVVMLAFYLDERRRERLTAMIIGFVALNAAIAICERLVGVNVFVFPNLTDTQYFRATALLGHPLENAFVTSSVMFLVPAMKWPAWRKFAVLAVCLAGILSFGARSSFGATIGLGAAAAFYFGARGLLRHEMRLSTMAAAPWIALLSVVAGSVLTFGTSLGERIVGLAKLDPSAQARLDVYRLFDYLTPSDLLYGVDAAEISFILKTYKEVEIIENCWIAILLMLGVILFVLFAFSLLAFLWSMARSRGAITAFAIVNLLLVASTSNSLSTQTPSLFIFSLALYGIRPRPRKDFARQRVAQHLSVRGAWS